MQKLPLPPLLVIIRYLSEHAIPPEQLEQHMFKKLLASIGIGAAKVDTILHTEHLLPGQVFQADILITGGDVAQELSGLELALMTRVKVETDDSHHFVNHVIQKWSLSDTIQLQPGEEIKLPFSAPLHPETPITELNTVNNQCHVWLATGLNIDMGVDASDKDILRIYPTEAMMCCLQFMEQAGYTMKKADVEKGFLKGPGFSSHSGIYQELEYRPKSSGFFSKKEVELSFVPTANETHVLIEIDSNFRGDSYKSFTIPHTQHGLEHAYEQLGYLLQ